MKKLLATLLVLALCVGNCVAFAEAEPVTLRVFFANALGTDAELVSETLSEYTMEKLGIKVELVGMSGSDFNSKIPLMIASDEKMDIGFDATWRDYIGRSRGGAYLALDELLNETPALVAELPAIMWEHAKVDGKIYGVPTKKEYATQWAFLAEKEFLDQEGIDISGMHSIYDVEPILEALKKYPERAGLLVIPSNYGNFRSMIRENGTFDGTSFDSTAAAVIRYGENEFQNFYDTQEFEDLVYLMRSWYEKGYIAEDVATIENYNAYTKDSHNYGLGTIGYSPLTEVNQTNSYGKEIVPIKVTPEYIRDNNAAASIFCVYAKCEHPTEAVKFLELWNTDAYVKNMITFSIEGKHYTLDENNQVSYIEGYNTLYSNGNWTSGNMFLSYLTKGDSPDKYEQYEAFNAAARASVTTGFQPVTDAFNDKIIAMNGVIAEYLPLMLMGTLDPDEYLPIFRDALHEVGVDDVIAGFQSQWEEFLATK